MMGRKSKAAMAEERAQHREAQFRALRLIPLLTDRTDFELDDVISAVDHPEGAIKVHEKVAEMEADEDGAARRQAWRDAAMARRRSI